MFRCIFSLVFAFYSTACAGSRKMSDDIFIKKIPFQLNFSCQVMDESLPKNNKAGGTKSKFISHSLNRANDPKLVYKKDNIEIKITVPVTTIQPQVASEPLVSTSQYTLIFSENGKNSFQVSSKIGGQIHFDYLKKKISVYCNSI